MKLSQFHFELPQASIATAPANPRDTARLLQVADHLTDCSVYQLPDLLNEGDILVLNNTKVIPARLKGMRGIASITITLHKEISSGKWDVFAKPAKRLQMHDRFIIADDFWADVVHKGENGDVTLQFNVAGADFYSLLSQYGEMPLPPYIKRNDNHAENDRHDYQTIYAAHEGAVAAPTAGLHFTEALLDAIRAKGIEIVYVTLHVGAGTFLPVKVDNIAEHKMHAEQCLLTKETADKINAVKMRGGRVVAVGTTSVRVLETAARDDGQLQAFYGDTSIFITPGYRFKIIDLLMTNFHLPCSTLFMLVCAFAGTEKMFGAYQHAIESGYRFYSYGDTSLLYRMQS